MFPCTVAATKSFFVVSGSYIVNIPSKLIPGRDCLLELSNSVDIGGATILEGKSNGIQAAIRRQCLGLYTE